MKEKIEFSYYELEWKNEPLGLSSSKKREGALLKINGGFADLHPWPELGDNSIKEELKNLSQGRPSALATRAVSLAKKDSVARAERRSQFENLKVPNSHALWDGHLNSLVQIKEEAFNCVKIKLSHASKLSLEAIKAAASLGLKVRLDPNSSWDPTILNELELVSKNSIEFIEDPLAFSPKAWREFYTDYKIPLALDFKREIDPESLRAQIPAEKTLDPLPFEYLILKPTVDDLNSWIEMAHQYILRVVVTSYLGHPLGAAAAAVIAGELKAKHPLLLDEAGLLSYRLYEENAYSSHLSSKGPLWLSPDGHGLGFDELLKREKWKTLA